MTYVHKAKYYYDTVEETDVVEIRYSNYIDNKWVEHNDYLYTWPLGDWKSLDFTKSGNFPEYKYFLNTMVHKNLEVYRRIAYVSLEEVIEDENKHIKIMNCIKILDNTFVPPIINKKCKWQIELLCDIVNKSFEIIENCNNKHRLDKYFRVFQLI